MAKVTLDLTKFKASGIYTLEFDASERIQINTQTVRLVVGFSRKGPINAPVYLPDKKTAKRVYGDIDPFLERRGCFFHRALYTCLDVGPVFGLALLPLNNDRDFGDKVPYQSFSISTTEPNGRKVKELYSSFFNKERFWYPDSDYFIANVNEHPINQGKLLNITNLGQSPASIIIKKAKVQGFDLTAREWYRNNVPTFLDDWDFISDYFVEVIVVRGDWSRYNQLSLDPQYSKYFDIRGLKKAQYKEFLASPEVEIVGTFTGCLIPDFVDGQGVNHSIDVIINGMLASTGIFVAINKEALENYDASANQDDTDNISAVDVIGHNFADPDRENPDIINFLSYKSSIKESMSFMLDSTFSEIPVDHNIGDSFGVESIHLGKQYGYLNNIVSIPKPLTDSVFDTDTYTSLRNLLVPGQSLVKLSNGKWAKIEQVYEEENTENSRKYLKLLYSHPGKAAEKDIVGINFTPQSFVNNQAVFISRSDVPADLISKFEDINQYPKVGETLLLKNATTKTWFYVKVKTTPTFTEVGGVKTMVTIPVEDTEAMDTLVLNPIGFKAIWGMDHFVDVANTLTFVQEPDVFKFVAGAGSANNPNKFIAYKYSKIYKYFEDGALLPGDKYYYSYNDPNYYYLNYDKTVDADGVPILEIKAYDVFTNGQFDYDITRGQSSGCNILTSLNFKRGTTSPIDVNANGILIYGVADNLYDPVQVISTDQYKTKFTVKPENAKQIEVGHYIVSQVKDVDGNPHYKLTKVIQKRKVYDPQTDTSAFEYTVNQPVYTFLDGGFTWVQRYYPIDDFIRYYQVCHLDGFKMTDYHYPGGLRKKEQLWKILGMLDSANSNLMEVLKSRDIITFRYIIDTFDGSVEPMVGPKYYLSLLAKERQKCLAFINFPSMKEFAQSTDPRFTEAPTDTDPKPVLNTRYIVEGGNSSFGMSTIPFSLPDEQNGSKFAGVFAPYLVLRENGKNIHIPPAAHVSNQFVLKFINGTPYSIVAGSKRGTLSDPKLVGLEYDFLDKDREYLEPYGVNPIVKKKNQGFVIFGNQMAYQKTSSAFNNLHVRDLLITIEEAVEDILSNYLFEFNNASTRLEIKTIVQSYLDGVRSNGGIYDFVVIMDESNNTPEVIDANTGILDIALEPARGIQKFINRVTVLKTGGISSGGFTIA